MIFKLSFNGFKAMGKLKFGVFSKLLNSDGCFLSGT
jgi:hypothetical protein